MAKRTKKVGSAGRVGSRYGVRARTKLRNVESIQKAKHICPSCGHLRVKRVSTSIWQCGKCGVKFAGGAYIPRTESGQSMQKLLRGDIKSSEISKSKEAIDEGEKK